jgi:predicted glutamine amidotransferase
MCRLFGLHAGSTAVTATFWLLDAPDSLAAQSRRNPDGAGIGVFGADGTATVDKQPIAAWDDTDFAAGARDLSGTTFVAHVRHASTGPHTRSNTHPFEQDGRLFAHNGVVEGLAQLEARLEQFGARGLVGGDTDSERMFALVTAEIQAHEGDVQKGVISALRWIADRLPVYSVNFILATAGDLWALRYPTTNELWLLERPAGGTETSRGLDARTDRIHARSDQLAERASVIFASEPMDNDPSWQLLNSGELVHVGPSLDVHRSIVFSEPPSYPLTLADLQPSVAASQRPVP